MPDERRRDAILKLQELFYGVFGEEAYESERIYDLIERIVSYFAGDHYERPAEPVSTCDHEYADILSSGRTMPKGYRYMLSCIKCGDVKWLTDKVVD
jgi:hypothetical protein